MHKLVIALLLALYWTGPLVFAETGAGESASGYLTSLPPSAPLPVAPSATEMQVPDTVEVIWSSTPHTASRTLQVSLAADFVDLLMLETGRVVSRHFFVHQFFHRLPQHIVNRERYTAMVGQLINFGIAVF